MGTRVLRVTLTGQPNSKSPNYPSPSAYKIPPLPPPNNPTNPQIHPFHLPLLSLGQVSPELANSQAELELEESNNQRVVLALYDALSSRDVDTVHKLLAPDLEWWFHGPPSHQFMMRLLTGTATSDDSFEFVPQSFHTIGSTVLVEGCNHDRSIAWIHAWTVGTNGIITQVREYFNTSLTVTRFGNDKAPPAFAPLHCPSLWESTLSNRVGKSVPGLVLAI